MTYSNTYYGEHTTMVNGNGKNPRIEDVIQVGKAAGLKKDWCEGTALKIRDVVNEHLKEYL